MQYVNRANPQSAKGEKSYYKLFVCYCIILLVGIFLPQSFRVQYSSFSFIFTIVVPICLVAGIYFKRVKKMRRGLLYISLWESFCVAFSLCTTANVIYISSQQDTHFFLSKIENVASSGYRSPAALFFQLDNVEVSLVVKNELPVKEKLERGQTVMISGQYKKGLFSSVMIVNYTIH